MNETNGKLTDVELAAIRERQEEIIRTVHSVMHGFSEMAEPFARIVAAVRQIIEPIVYPLQTAIQAWAPAVHEALIRWSEQAHRSKALDQAGWLPHYTAPLLLIENNPDWSAEKIRDEFEKYYIEQWQSVREQFESMISGLKVNESAKACFKYALNLHEQKHYRLVPLLLFSDLERTVRIEMNLGVTKGLASQQELRELAGGLPMGTAHSGGDTIRLFLRLEDHLFAHVHSKDALEKHTNDPVPNRHAAMHGLIVYDRHATSINMLIMADYMLQLLSAYNLGAAQIEGQADKGGDGEVIALAGAP